jgi:hypothetical protein
MPEDGKHYVTVFVGARVADGAEPEVCIDFYPSLFDYFLFVSYI